MIIGIDCRTKRDENGELWVRCAPVIKDADKRQKATAAGLIIAGAAFALLLIIGMYMTDLPHADAVEVTGKYGVMR
ncbi:MAG TPA: hypothetical protein DCZ59_04315 [Bacteroidetes bacterium]|nr:hypothetical protein [Bacteroidota bacterium]